MDQYVVLQDYIFAKGEEGVALTADGVHPNEEGQKYIPQQVAIAINKNYLI